MHKQKLRLFRMWTKVTFLINDGMCTLSLISLICNPKFPSLDLSSPYPL